MSKINRNNIYIINYNHKFDWQFFVSAQRCVLGASHVMYTTGQHMSESTRVLSELRNNNASLDRIRPTKSRCSCLILRG